jgi:hypothetical protein
LFIDWIFREGFAPGYDAGGAGSVRDGNLFKGKFIHLKRCINGIFTRFLSQPLSFVLARLKWYFVSKIALVIEKFFWDHYNNESEQWKVRTIFGNRMLF